MKAGQYKHSEERRLKISEAIKGRKHSPEAIERMRKAKLGKKMADETRAKISASQRGRKMSAEFSAKLSLRMVGNTYGKNKKREFTEEHKANLAKAARGRKGQSAEQNPNWLGDRVGYNGLHTWVRNELGTPSLCEHCGCTDAPVFDWANKTGKYLRLRDDWLRLCRSCHMKYDKRGFQNTVKISHDGKEQTLKEWADDLGIKYMTLYSRLFTYKMPVEKALTAKVSRSQTIQEPVP